MPEENRVFDVAKPGHSSPEATSKPVIVGHQPSFSDPMVKDGPASDEPTKIMVHDDEHKPFAADSVNGGAPAIMDPGDEPDTHGAMDSPADHSLISMPEDPKPDWQTQPAEPAAEPPSGNHKTAANDELTTGGDHPADDERPADTPAESSPLAPIGHVEGLHVSPPRRRFSAKWALLIILLLILGAYLLIDSGAVGSSINLPFHIFKQKSAAPAAQAPAASSQKPANANTAALPNGFTDYKLAGTSITFAAPTAWGVPTSTTDPGYSSRSAGAKSDGTYAYLVDFATNKDVEVAVTSSKYLPAARGALYYDFLQWCTGTSDGKIYQSILHFSTANKVDTPTTTSCDQGPLADATKLDSTTIVQLKTKDSSGAVLGDLYTKNLTSSDLQVLRVKDKAMTNGSDIKSLLSTVKSPNGTAVTQ